MKKDKKKLETDAGVDDYGAPLAIPADGILL
jgi:hypothetical protein